MSSATFSARDGRDRVQTERGRLRKDEVEALSDDFVERGGDEGGEGGETDNFAELNESLDWRRE